MKKTFVKWLTVGLAAVCAFGAFTGCTKREDKLVIRNWGEYMDPEIYQGFESWYKEKTGKTVKVDYKEFDTNESMYTDLTVGNADDDLVCPSDYMAERMIKNGQAQKIDTEIFNVKADGLFYDGLMDMATTVDKNNEYFVPYVWGTMGIMYNAETVSASDAQDMHSWDALWSEKYSGKILMKDSVRDSYSIAQIKNQKSELTGAADYQTYGPAYQAILSSIFETCTDATIAAAKATLLRQKPLLEKYEVDDGKESMLSGTANAQLGLFWSCDAGYIMQEEGGDKFMYIVPDEGSNVWVDGWIIPTGAKNATAANWFLQYISQADVAKQNMDWMGTSVAIKAAMDAAKEEFEEETFEGAVEGFKEMYIEMVFPTQEVLARCKIMRDFGEEMSVKLDEMWTEVRAE